MTLMRSFSKMDKEGKIAIPGNIRRETGLSPGQLVEIKLSGPQLAQYLTIRKRGQAR